MIPKVAHRIWADEPAPGGQLGEFWDAFRAMHPDWRCITWDSSAEIRKLVSESNLERFDWAMEHSPYGEAPDIGRYAILAKHGGVYWDADMLPLRPLDELLEDPRPFAAWESERTICSAVLAAPPNHPAILDVIAALPDRVRRYKGKTPNYTTGPELLTEVWKGRTDVRRLPPWTFYPFSWSEPERRGQHHPDSYAAHQWFKGWGPKQAPKPKSQTGPAIDALATRPHYLEHIAPIWEALDPEVRGTFTVSAHLQELADELGLDTEVLPRNQRLPGDDLLIIAGDRDYRIAAKRKVVWVEHGAGQTYSNTHPAHPGGKGRERTALFVCPSERVAELNRKSYPDIPAAAVGCPRLDPWHAEPLTPEPGLVAFTWHFASTVSPEAGSAFDIYKQSVAEYAKTHEVIGTCHPRIARKVVPFYEQAGIPYVGWQEVFDRAALLVVDNSSVGWEFLSLDRPVVWLNSPRYRRNVEHGLRFWEFADSGVQVDSPEELAVGIDIGLSDPQSKRRAEVIPEVYAECDGKAALRAAEAITQTLRG